MMNEKTKQCGRCHTKIDKPQVIDKFRQPICPHCGYIEGSPVTPCIWVCEECGEIDIDHGTDKKPICPDCGVGFPMSVARAGHSPINGAGLGDYDLDLGLDLLISAQAVDLELGSQLLRDAQDG
jgi:hypothetical protein